MNAKFLKIIALPMLAASLLAACGGSNNSSNEEDVSSSEINTSITSSDREFDLSSHEDISIEEGTSLESYLSSQEGEFVDYVHNGSVTLGLEYTGRDFYVDGIGQFTLKTSIDGDTAHFTPMVDSLGKGTMKARFYGIDTPESTGKVQEYGKPASYFTKEKLEEANLNGTIVISSAQEGYGTPNPDSTGSRYVSLVWVNLTKKNAPINELYLLNLWIVQEGLSWSKNVLDMPEYAQTFYDAENQARAFKLNMFSGKPDPYFNYGDYQDVSLLEVKYEILATLENSSHKNKFDGEKIRFTGTIAGFANHILYIQEFCYYDPDDESKGGEWCGINVFVGMTDPVSKYITPNTYVSICGLAQDSENFGFQVTDVQGKFPIGTPMSENDTRIIIAPEDNTDEHSLYTFQFTANELDSRISEKNYDNLNCSTEVTTEVKVSRVYISDDLEITLYFQGVAFQAYIPFGYKGDPDSPRYRWKTEEDFLNKKFMLKGVFTYHITTSGKIVFQINPSTSADLVWVQE